MDDDPPAGAPPSAPPGADRPAWWLYRGTGQVLAASERDRRWPPPPRWRAFDGTPEQPPPPPAAADPQAARRLGTGVAPVAADPQLVARVNAALYLRRPLLVTGPAGSGKSSLAYRIAHELDLGRVLRWPVTTRTTLQSGLYEYDAIGRVQAANRQSAGDLPSGEAAAGAGTVGDYIRLGPLGTALLAYRLPRVLLIDELDHGDVDLPHDLRDVFASGEFEIRELARVAGHTPQVRVHTADPGRTATVHAGQVRCREFPLVVITGTDERDLPASFVRQCIQVTVPEPDEAALAAIVAAHFPDHPDVAQQVLPAFLRRRERFGGLSADQLLDEVALHTCGIDTATGPLGWEELVATIWPAPSGSHPAGPG